MYMAYELMSACYVVAAVIVLVCVPASCDEHGGCLRALEHPSAYTVPSSPQLLGLSRIGRTLFPVCLSSTATVAVLMARPGTYVSPINSLAAILITQAVGVCATVLAGLTIGSHVSVFDDVAGNAYSTTPLFATAAVTSNVAAIIWVHLARHSPARIQHNAELGRKLQ